MNSSDSTTALVSEIEAAARRFGLAPTTLCRIIVHDGKFYRRLKEGGDCTLRTADRIRSTIKGMDADLRRKKSRQNPVKVNGSEPICTDMVS